MVRDRPAASASPADLIGRDREIAQIGAVVDADDVHARGSWTALADFRAAIADTGRRS